VTFYFTYTPYKGTRIILVVTLIKLVPMWHLDPSNGLATTHMGPKLGAVPHWGERSPHLTQFRMGQRLPPYSKWHLDPSCRLATTDRGKGTVPLLRGAGSLSNTVWPGPRPTSVPSGILIHPAVWPQQTWDKNWELCPF